MKNNINSKNYKKKEINGKKNNINFLIFSINYYAKVISLFRYTSWTARMIFKPCSIGR